MATKSISQLDTQATANETDLFEVAIVDANSASGYASKKESAAAIADAIVGSYQYPLRITGTTAKTIAGAINELKNLVDLLPQFAIEVVQTLPVSDISETTIYLVPASDPEQGNYYEEYIYVNNAWELVGTTAVDLSGYYTSAQVDTLLAAKADSSSLATVATSGAYSDLTGKPTIDTALDTTSANAVENRAVASEINSIKSDITVDGSASGDIATFVDGSDNPLKELKISIVPVQDLHGQSNPYPAGGGKNKFQTTAQSKEENGVTWTVNSDGTITVSGTATGYTALLLGEAKVNSSMGVVTISGLSNNVVNMIWSSIVLLDSNDETLYTVAISGTSNYSVDLSQYPTAEKIRMSIKRNSNAAVSGTIKPQVELGSTATAFAPYENICPISGWTGATIHRADGENPHVVDDAYSISWQSTAGTVYGGTLNVKTGELIGTHLIIDMGDIEWEYYTAGNYPYFIGGVPNDNIHHVTNDMLMCSCYKVLPARTAGNFREFDYDECITIITSQLPAHRIGVQDSDYTDPTVFKTAVTGQKIVYPLVTPITYQLTPTEIRSLLGINNVWADCGAVTELKYTRDLNLCINNIIARIEALESGSSTRSLSVSPVLTKSLTSDSDTAEGKTEEETEEETKEEAQNER